MFNIEKNVAYNGIGQSASFRGEISSTMRAMNVGESFLVPFGSKGKKSASAYTRALVSKFAKSLREEPGFIGCVYKCAIEENGIRVFRLA